MEQYTDRFVCTVTGNTKADRDQRAQEAAEAYYGEERFRLIEVGPSRELKRDFPHMDRYETEYLFSDYN